jgi:hypothetical protein
MSDLIKYREARALEDVAFRLGGTPVRLFRILLPVWQTEVRATIYESEPYNLIDRYVDAAVGRCGLGTVAELAGFLGLDELLMDRAVRFLTAIGHLERDPATRRLMLSDLGQMSVREGKRYRRELEDRRKLYFNGFTSRPLSRPYYDVTFLDKAAVLAELATRGGGPAFTPVHPFSVPELAPTALSWLAEMKDRDRYNLPMAVISPTLTGPPTPVRLPAYVVRAVVGGKVRHLAYTQVADTADEEWSAVCSAAPDITAVAENEHREDQQGHEDTVRQWVSARFAGRFRLEQRDTLLQATLPADAFTRSDSDPDSGIALSRLGSFVMINTWFFRLWCEDDTLRYQALLKRADGYLGSRTRANADDTMAHLEQFGRQLGLGPMSADELRALAENAGMHALAARFHKLAQLNEEP